MAIVKSRLTQVGLDESEMFNYCLISNISFLYKVQEKVVTPSLFRVSQGLVLFCCIYFKLLLLHTYLPLIILKCIRMLMIINQSYSHSSPNNILQIAREFVEATELLSLKSSFTWSCQSSVHLVWHLRPTIKYRLFVFAAYLPWPVFLLYFCIWYSPPAQSFGVHFINMQ